MPKIERVGHSITVNDDKLYGSMLEYCRNNGLKISSFCTELLKDAFYTEVYGDIPFGTVKEKNDVGKEEIVFDIPEEIKHHAEESLLNKANEKEKSMDEKMEKSEDAPIDATAPSNEPVIVKTKKRRL